MEFDNCEYSVQQVAARTRDEKVKAIDRDTIEKQRLAARHEHFERHHIIDNLVKPESSAPYSVDDVERFNRDYTMDQKTKKIKDHEMMLARAAHRRQQQEDYEKSIELRRQIEAEEDRKRQGISGAHDFNVESVLYDPVTNLAPAETTDRGATLRTQDATHEFRREARARRIYHNANSVKYDPITGEERKFW